MVFKFVSISLLFVLSFINYSASLNSDEAEQLHVIGNGAPSTMDFDRLVGIFRGEEALWDNKKSIIIVLPSSKNETAEEIAKTIFNGSVMTMKKYWLGLVFQGRANPPVFLDSNEDIINYVQKNQGAIGILYCKKEIVPQSLLINIAE